MFDNPYSVCNKKYKMIAVPACNEVDHAYNGYIMNKTTIYQVIEHQIWKRKKKS